ncbi:MAG: Ig-like domain-containing protein [Gemmatimonadota bacterium]
MKPRFSLLVGSTVAIVSACTSAPTSVAVDLAATVLSVSPVQSSAGVDPAAPIVVTFNRGMMAAMERLVVLHEGSVRGAAIAGAYTWSSDRRSLTFRPDTPLRSSTMYVLHLAPDLRTDDGGRLNHEACTSIGGRSVSQQMMGGGMMSAGSMGPGMMGSGWLPISGSYGMVFSFTTA